MRIKQIFFSLVFTANATIGWSGAVVAGEINFNVPVDVKSYPIPNQRLAIWCELNGSDGKVVRKWIENFVLSDGKFSGPKSVRVAYDDKEAIKIKSYNCLLLVSVSSIEGDPRFIPPTPPLDATVLAKVSGSAN